MGLVNIRIILLFIGWLIVWGDIMHFDDEDTWDSDDDYDDDWEDDDDDDW